MATSASSPELSPFHQKKGFYFLNFEPGSELYTTFRAVVYQGFHARTMRRIVAKRIRVGKKEEYVAMAENEADILIHSPPHDNVIKIYSVIKEDVVNDISPEVLVDVYIMMEHCELGDLTKFAYDHKLDIDQKVDIMLQCALGLEHLHNLSPPVIHRDVKPSNVFLFGNPASPTAKLGDLGEAHFLHRDDEHTLSLHSHHQYGTPSYMAPELYKPRKSYTKMVDIFALGMTFHSLLNAKKEETMVAMKGNFLNLSSYKRPLFFFKCVYCLMLICT